MPTYHLTTKEDSVITVDVEDVSDGHHTFQELYSHRYVLFIALASTFEDGVYSWRSKLHADGTMFENSFILGIFKTRGEQITYHLPLHYWELTNFVETLDQAPEWDGHSPTMVMERLIRLI